MRAKEVLRRRARGGGGGSVGTVCTLATVNNKQPGRCQYRAGFESSEYASESLNVVCRFRDK